MAVWMEVKIMRFDTRQLIERLALALGMAVAGLVLFGAVARSHGAPILAEHVEAGDRVAALGAPAQLGDHPKLADPLKRPPIWARALIAAAEIWPFAVPDRC
jgi:hypothetical protein